MTRLLAWVVVGVLGLGMRVEAQSLVGIWQGTLPLEKNPRMILRFAEAPDGALRGVLVRIDQGDWSIALTTIVFHARDVSVASDLVATKFDGKLSADGKSLSGAWTQEGKSYPMVLTLTPPGAMWTHDYGTIPPPMAVSADPSFEVAAIKPAAPDSVKSFRLRTRHIQARDQSVLDMVELAYGLRDRQVEGALAWMKDLKFDVDAEPDVPGIPSEEQSMVMFKKLLGERFHLTAHIVQKTFPVYALTPGKEPAKVVPTEPGFYDRGNISVKQLEDGDSRLNFSHFTMKDFAGILMNFQTDRQVVDETGLPGAYDFTLVVPPGMIGGKTDPGETLSPVDALFHATEAQLGLHLVRKDAPLDVLVIDRVEKPTEN